MYCLLYCCCSITKSCLTLCNPMNWSMPGFPALQYLPELAQTHVHWVSDTIKPSHPLSPPSPLALSLSQHQVLFQSGSSLHQVAKVMELQHRSFQWIFGLPLWLTGLIPLLSKGVSRVFKYHSSKVLIQKHCWLRKNKFSYKPMYHWAKRKTDFVPFEVQ